MSESLREFEHFARHVVVYDHDYVLLAVSDDLAALFGYKRRDLIGQPGWDVVSRQPGAHEHIRWRLKAGASVTGVAYMETRRRERFRYSYTTRVLNGGELHVAWGEPLPNGITPEAISPDELLRAPTGAFDWMTKEEAADYARITVATLERRVGDGMLPVGGHPGKRLFHRTWLDEMMGL